MFRVRYDAYLTQDYKNMSPHILLAQIKALLARKPSFDSYTSESLEHHTWLGQAYALIVRWNSWEGSSFKIECDFLGSSGKERRIATILGTLHRAVADIELSLPKNTQQAFGPGALYDFFKALSEVLKSAQKSLFIIDPFINDSIFDTYLSSLPSNVSVRLLARDFSANLKPASKKFIAQCGTGLELKKSITLHDRIIFVDGSECWVLGQSIKDAAASKPTYLAPLSADVTLLKLTDYEDIWLKALTI